MKIAVVGITEATTEQEKYYHEKYITLFRKNLERAAADGTEIEIRECSPALRRGWDTVVPFFLLLDAASFLREVYRAYKEGADAIIIACSEDPGFEEAKRLVDVPVLGIGEAGMHLASMLGEKFAIVTLNDPSFVAWWEKQVKRYGFHDRLTEVVPIDMSFYETVTKGWENPEIVAADAAKKAEECVQRGAEVIILGSLGLGIMCTAANLSKVEGVDAPILDLAVVGLKMAELRVELKKKFGIPAVSRAHTHRLLREKDIERVMNIFRFDTHE
jgi:Asp/Glu/hydantoin racemase